MMIQVGLISLGAVFGALGRWWLGVWLNPLLQQLAFGTFLANILGCFLIGITLGLNLQDSHKLLFVTGFLGSFTTFSSLSAEVISQFLAEKWLNGLAIFGLHSVFGIAATAFGVGLVMWLK